MQNDLSDMISCGLFVQDIHSYQENEELVVLGQPIQYDRNTTYSAENQFCDMRYKPVLTPLLFSLKIIALAWRDI